MQKSKTYNTQNTNSNSIEEIIFDYYLLIKFRIVIKR